MKLGERIRQLRRSHELSLSELARECGMTASALCNIERCKVNPKLETLDEIAGAFKMNVSGLLQGVEPYGRKGYGRYKFPPGLQEFVDDPEYEDEITEEWLELLLNITVRGKYPTKKRDWISLYLDLRKLFPEV